MNKKYIYLLIIVCQIIFFISLLIIFLSVKLNLLYYIMLLIILYPITIAFMVYFLSYIKKQSGIIEQQEEINKELRKQKHTFLNYLEIGLYFINMNMLKEAKKYFEDIGVIITTTSLINNIENKYIKAILNIFAIKAEKKSVAFYFNNEYNYDFVNFPLSPIHTTKVINNILQNALENCQQKEGYINLDVEIDKKYLILRIENNGKPFEFNGKSNKGDGRGNGLNIVDEILNEYESCSLALECVDPPTFTLKLKLNKEEGSND